MSDNTKSRQKNHGGLPPMFADSFRDNGPEWKRISGVDFEGIGRILACHLIIEHYLSKLIEFQTPKEFDWDESKLTFAQKVKILRKYEPLIAHDFIKGVEVLNRIRNKFSHKSKHQLESLALTLKVITSKLLMKLIML
jgi:hypothetical protein